MVNTKIKTLELAHVLKYRIQSATYDLGEDSVHFNLKSSVADMPKIWVSVKHFRYFASNVVRATVLDPWCEMNYRSRNHIEALARAMYVSIRSYLKEKI